MVFTSQFVPIIVIVSVISTIKTRRHDHKRSARRNQKLCYGVINLVHLWSGLVTGFLGRSLYGKSKSDSVSQSVTRSPIELFWTAKKTKKTEKTKKTKKTNKKDIKDKKTKKRPPGLTE